MIDRTAKGLLLKLATFKVGEANRGRKVGELFLKAAFRYATENRLEHIFVHGDKERHHFLFEMLREFGFELVGDHPGSDGRDSVYLKEHPVHAPNVDIPPFEYHRRYFPHFRDDPLIEKFVVPIRPAFHRVLFPEYQSIADIQRDLFPEENYAGNAIKMAYLCRAQTRRIDPGSVVMFYRSGDDRALTSIGVVESYEQLSDADAIISRVRRRTVYSLEQIVEMARRPTRVMLFRFVRHFSHPIPLHLAMSNRILNGQPQSVSRISHDAFERAFAVGG